MEGVSVARLTFDDSMRSDEESCTPCCEGLATAVGRKVLRQSEMTPPAFRRGMRDQSQQSKARQHDSYTNTLYDCCISIVHPNL